ncbi:DUF1877 family protein [Streptacidiphilus sp. NEAU-YB345]|uniref:DUF1877 family protein n=2 Tax=Streptacidiphilus fuscans TaxID=2789292 RepID=A0A931AX96_9ACTN|nr:DUF1877 family protein [Streptacidiphilus fuscans]
MLTAWSNHQEEYAAGIADSIEKDFEGVNHLYTGDPDGHEGAGSPSGLPVFGGDLVPHEDGPPFVILQPVQVKEAAAFLNAADFDSLWDASGAAISAPWGDLTLAREIYLSHHEGLVAFYQTASQAGNAVIKAFWY